MTGEAASHNVVAQQPRSVCLLHGYLRAMDSQGVLVAHIEVGPGCAYREALDHHPFENEMRVAFEETAVLEYVRLTFVRVADNVFGRVASFATSGPLCARRKACA